MRRFLAVLSVLAILFPQETWSTPASDSIIAFTGAKTKLVWRRYIWADQNYQPLPKSGLFSKCYLMLFDTDAGVERCIDTVPQADYTRISRSGNWVTYNDYGSNSTYIKSLVSNAPRKVLLSKSNCSYWCVRAMWSDPATKTEYVFCLDNYDKANYQGNGIWKVPFDANGTADMSKATKIAYSGGAAVDDAIAVSADGKKLGGAWPWPNTKILDIASGQMADRHNGMFGCQANLAPDNSYRFLHCDDDHYGVVMFGENMSTTNWGVNLQNTTPAGSCQNQMDFAAPRWSNHVQFFTNTYPLTSYLDGDPCGWNNIDPWSLSAADVKTKVNPNLISNFILTKWSADFKSAEKTLNVCHDLRYFQMGGDAWIASGIVGGQPVAAGRSPQAPKEMRGTSLVRDGDVLTVSYGTSHAGARLTDAQGRLVRRWVGGSAVAVDTKSLNAGVYVISVGSAKGSFTQRVTVAR